MEKSRFELSVGITSLIGIAMLILGSLWGKDIGFASKQQGIVFSFANSGGLRPGDPATVNGVKKGRVEDISLRQNEVLIRVLLDEKVQLFEDVQAIITMQDLMGGHKLEISPGVSNRPLQAGSMADPIAGAEVIGIGEMFAEAYSLKPKVDTLLVAMQTAMAEMNVLLDRDKLRDPLHRSLQNLSDISGELSVLLKETRPKFKGTLDHVHAVSQTMDTLLTKNRRIMEASLSDLSRVTAKMDTLTSSLQEMSSALRRREGTIGKLIYEDALYSRLQHTVNGMDSLTIELRKNLGKYLNGADIKLLNLIDF